MALASPTMRRAQPSTRSPSGVKPWKRDERRTIVAPSASSSERSAADSVGWSALVGVETRLSTPPICVKSL